MRGLAFAVTVVFSFFLFCLPIDARANGRFPRALSILTPAGGDGSTVYLRATFGLLVSKDAGKTWTWICEEAMGFSGTWDPPVAVAKDGRVYAGLENGLRQGEGGCAFAEIPELKGQIVRDVTLDPAADGVAAVTSAPKQFTYVWRADKAGKMQRLGPGVDGVLALTLEIAPSKPSRVYVTAQSTTVPDARLFRSDDGGTTLKELKVPMPQEPGEEPGRLFVSAIDPMDPERVLFRRLTNKGSEIVLSTDGGTTMKTVLRMQSALFGFAAGPDGATYYAGSGVAADGIHVSRDRGATWQPLAKMGVLCLLAAGKRVFACNNTGPGDLLSVSTDGAKTFETVSRLRDVEPAVCAKCDAPWPKVRAVLRPDLGDSGRDDAADSGGLSPSPMDAGITPTRPVPSARASKGGCGCRVSAPPDDRGVSLAWGLAALLVGAIARRNQDPERSR